MGGVAAPANCPSPPSARSASDSPAFTPTPSLVDSLSLSTTNPATAHIVEPSDGAPDLIACDDEINLSTRRCGSHNSCRNLNYWHTCLQTTISTSPGGTPSSPTTPSRRLHRRPSLLHRHRPISTARGHRRTRVSRLTACPPSISHPRALQEGRA